MTTDMSPAIVPKSDQISADDLLSGPRTFKILGVSIKPGTEQPVEIAIEGERPWRPCKGMSRILVAAWGPDASKYTGRSVTLFRDPTIKWGGLEVGGIRISHMSDIDGSMTTALTMTKGSKKAFTVKPLATPAATKPATPPPADSPALTGETSDFADMLENDIDTAIDAKAIAELFNETIKGEPWGALRAADPARAKMLKDKATEKIAALKE